MDILAIAQMLVEIIVAVGKVLPEIEAVAPVAVRIVEGQKATEEDAAALYQAIMSLNERVSAQEAAVLGK